jgi:SAM-dependent methyltransferase
MVQQDPAVSPEIMERQYAMFSNYLSFDEGPPPLSPTTERMLEILARQSISPGRVYDVGAATGEALWHFRRNGWVVSGCEPSPAAVEQARRLRDVTLDHGFEEQVVRHQDGFDLITMSHVLEHLYSPAETLRRLRTALTGHGLLLIEVPCLAVPQSIPPGMFTMEHVNYFDPVSIANLLWKCGFEPIHSLVVETTNYYAFPVVTVLARKTGETRPMEYAVARSMEFLRRYVVQEAQQWHAASARMERALEPGEPVYIWGAGLHTSNLIGMTSLAANHPIAGITDRDTQKHGQTLGAYAVVPPPAVLNGSAPIVISSYGFEHEIGVALERQGVQPRRIVKPHGRPPKGR